MAAPLWVRQWLCRWKGCDDERMPDSSVYSMPVRVFKCRRCGIERWEQSGRVRAVTTKGGD